ncbi:hypothetical protein D1007_32837 [Hordeum vulgare]|nr:hypothetical protein D1007_32837 [Hordeum vulgare]
MAALAIPLHIHALLTGLLPPFSSFLIAVLLHYQNYALQLDPRSSILHSAFTFLCEAFVGVTPSVALLCHFFSLEPVSKQQCSRCASLKAVDALAPGALDVVLLLEAEGFRQRWVLVEAAEAGALLRPPLTPAMLNHGWMHRELSESRFAPVLTQLEELKRARWPWRCWCGSSSVDGLLPSSAIPT